MKKILYIDMDNVLVDFTTGIEKVGQQTKIEYEGCLDEVPDIFSLMAPVKDAIESFNELAECYETYILSTSPWENETAWKGKLNWVKKYIGEKGYKRLILTHHKHLNKGDFLIDDRRKNGAGKFEGELIEFGSKAFPDWLTTKTICSTNLIHNRRTKYDMNILPPV